MNPVHATILVVFCPSKFVEAAVLHDVALEFETNTQLCEKFPDRRLSPDRLQVFRDTALERTRKIRQALFVSILVTIATIAVGWLIGLTLRKAFWALRRPFYSRFCKLWVQARYSVQRLLR